MLALEDGALLMISCTYAESVLTSLRLLTVLLDSNIHVVALHASGAKGDIDIQILISSCMCT